MPKHDSPIRYSEGRLRLRPFYANDFLAVSTNPFFPFVGVAVASGTAGTVTTGATANHPGVIRLTSSTTTNSGYFIGTNITNLILGGGESAEAIFNIAVLAGTTIRLGFHDSTTSGDAADGCYIEIAETGVATGKTANNAARSSTGTTTTLSATTWYRANVTMNADATLATFSIYSDAGALLWTDSLSTNIPTTSGRECGMAAIATNSGTSAIDLLYLDYMAISFSRTLTRGA